MFMFMFTSFYLTNEKRYTVMNIGVSGSIRAITIKFPWGFIYNRRCEVNLTGVRIALVIEVPQNVSSVPFSDKIKPHGNDLEMGYKKYSRIARRGIQSMLENIHIVVNDVEVSLKCSEGFWEGKKPSLRLTLNARSAIPASPFSRKWFSAQESYDSYVKNSVTFDTVKLSGSSDEESVEIVSIQEINLNTLINLERNSFIMDFCWSPFKRFVWSFCKVKGWPNLMLLDPEEDQKKERVVPLKSGGSTPLDFPIITFATKNAGPNASTGEEGWGVPTTCSAELHKEGSRQAILALQHYNETDEVPLSRFLAESHGCPPADATTPSRWSLGFFLQGSMQVSAVAESLLVLRDVEVDIAIEEGKVWACSASIRKVHILEPAEVRTAPTREETWLRAALRLGDDPPDLSVTCGTASFEWSSEKLSRTLLAAVGLGNCIADIPWFMLAGCSPPAPAEVTSTTSCVIHAVAASVDIIVDEEICISCEGIEWRDSGFIRRITVQVGPQSLVHLEGIELFTAPSHISVRKATLFNALEGAEKIIQCLVALQSKLPRAELKSTRETLSNPVTKIGVMVNEVQFECLGLRNVQIGMEFLNGWHIAVSGRGFSAPLSASPDAAIEILLWADDYLMRSPFAGDIDSTGIGFVVSCQNVALVVSEQLVQDVEFLYDLVMLLLFRSDDSHVYLRESTRNISHVSGCVYLSDVQLTLSEQQMQTQILPAVVVRAPGRKAVEISVRRSRDKKIQVGVNLNEGVTAALRDVDISPIELLPHRDGGQLSILISMTAPASAQLPLFPFARLKIDVQISRCAVVPHMPTVMALWRFFDTPGALVFRLKNLPSRFHFCSRPCRGRSPPPPSPNSSFYASIGAASMDRYTTPQAPTKETLAGLYTTPVFPVHLVLHVTAKQSVVYYPHGDGDEDHAAVPMYFYTPAHCFDLLLTSRAGLTKLDLYAVCDVPRVRCSTRAVPLDDPTCATARTRKSIKESNETKVSVRLAFTFDRRVPLRSQCGEGSPLLEIPALETMELCISGPNAGRGIRAAFSPEEVAAYATLLSAERSLKRGWRAPGVPPVRTDPRFFTFRLQVDPAVLCVPCLGLAVVLWNGFQWELSTTPARSALSIPRLACVVHESIALKLPRDSVGLSFSRLQELEAQGFAVLQLRGVDSGTRSANVERAAVSYCSPPADHEVGRRWRVPCATVSLTEEVLVASRNVHALHYLQLLLQLAQEQRRAIETLAEEGKVRWARDPRARSAGVRLAAPPGSPGVVFRVDAASIRAVWCSMLRAGGLVSVSLRSRALQFRDGGGSSAVCPEADPTEDPSPVLATPPLGLPQHGSPDSTEEAERVVVLEEGQAWLCFHAASPYLATPADEAATWATDGIPLLRPFTMGPEVVAADTADGHKTISKLSSLHLELTTTSYLLLCEAQRRAHVLVASSLDPPVPLRRGDDYWAAPGNADGEALEAMLERIREPSAVPILADVRSGDETPAEPASRPEAGPEPSQRRHYLGIYLEEVRVGLVDFTEDEAGEVAYWRSLRRRWAAEHRDVSEDLGASCVSTDVRLSSSFYDSCDALGVSVHRRPSTPLRVRRGDSVSSDQGLSTNRLPSDLGLRNQRLEVALGPVTYLHDQLLTASDDKPVSLVGIYAEHLSVQLQRPDRLLPPLLELQQLCWRTQADQSEPGHPGTTVRASIQSAAAATDSATLGTVIEMLVEQPTACLAAAYSSENPFLGLAPFSGAMALRHLLHFTCTTTNHITVLLGSHTLRLDPSGGRVLIVVDDGLSVTLTGGAVQLPAECLPDGGVPVLEDLLLPYVALGEGSYVECRGVRCAFAEASPPTRRRVAVATPSAPGYAARRRSGALVVECLSLHLSPCGDASGQTLRLTSTLEAHRLPCGSLDVRLHRVCLGTARRLPAEGNAGWSTGDTVVVAGWSAEFRSTGGRYAAALGDLHAEVAFYDAALWLAVYRDVAALRRAKQDVICSPVERAFRRMIDETLSWREASTAAGGGGEPAEAGATGTAPAGTSVVVVLSKLSVRLSSRRAPLVAVGAGPVVAKAVAGTSDRQTSLRLDGLYCRVFGKGSWDVVLRPTAALNWEQRIKLHSRHTLCELDRVELRLSLLTALKLHHLQAQLRQLPTLRPSSATAEEDDTAGLARDDASTSHCFTNTLDQPLYLFFFPLHRDAPARITEAAAHEIIEVPATASVRLSLPYKRAAELYACVLSRRSVAGSGAGFRLREHAAQVSPRLAGLPVRDLQYGEAKGLMVDDSLIVLSCTEDFYTSTRQSRGDVVYQPSQWQPGRVRPAAAPALAAGMRYAASPAQQAPPLFLRRAGEEPDVIHVHIHAKTTIRNETGLPLLLAPHTPTEPEAEGPIEGYTAVPSGAHFPLYRACSALRVRAARHGRAYGATLGLESGASSCFLSLLPVGSAAQDDDDGSAPLCHASPLDRRPLILYVVSALITHRTCTDIILLPRLTVINAVGAPVALSLWQRDPQAGPPNSTDARMMQQWSSAHHHEVEVSVRHKGTTSPAPPPDLVLLGAHHDLHHEEALCLPQCTYTSDLHLGISFAQPTGERISTPYGAVVEVCADLRRVALQPGSPPVCLRLQQPNGRSFYLLVTVRHRTITLSVGMWVCNMTNYPLQLSDHWITRTPVAGVGEEAGVSATQGAPFLLGVLLHRFDHAFMKIGLDGDWSAAFPVGIGASGVMESYCRPLQVMRSCNYTVYFPNAKAHQPAVMLVTSRWVFCNLTGKRLRVHLNYPGLARAAAAPRGSSDEAEAERVAKVQALSSIYLRPKDFYVSCIGPRSGNTVSLEEDLAGTVPSLGGSGGWAGPPQPIPVDAPGEAMFNLWAVPTPPQPQLATWDGATVVAYPPQAVPHPLGRQRGPSERRSRSSTPTEVEPSDELAEEEEGEEAPPLLPRLTLFDPETALDAAVTGRLAVAVTHTHDNVLVVSIRPVETTKICIQNRTGPYTVLARQEGNARRSTVPSCQNRFFSWEEPGAPHVLLVHLLGSKGSWYRVDLSSGQCQVRYETQTPRVSGSRPFYVVALTNRRKNQVHILVCASPPPPLQLAAASTSEMTVLRLSSLEVSYQLRCRPEEQRHNLPVGEGSVADEEGLAPEVETEEGPTRVALVVHGLALELLDAEDTQHFHLAVEAAQLIRHTTAEVAPVPILYRARVGTAVDQGRGRYRAAVLHGLLSGLYGAFDLPHLLEVQYHIIKFPDGMRRLTDGTAELAPVVLEVTDMDLAEWIVEGQEAQRCLRAIAAAGKEDRRHSIRRAAALDLEALHPDVYLSNIVVTVVGQAEQGPGGEGARRTESTTQTESFVLLDRLRISTLSLYLSFRRHGGDPLRPLLGPYTLMLPNRLDHTEFTLQFFELRHRLETPGSLRSHLRHWCRAGLREQWAKVTRLGSLVEWLRRTGQLPLQPRPPPLQVRVAEVRSLPQTPDPSTDRHDDDDDGDRLTAVASAIDLFHLLSLPASSPKLKAAPLFSSPLASASSSSSASLPQYIAHPYAVPNWVVGPAAEVAPPLIPYYRQLVELALFHDARGAPAIPGALLKDKAAAKKPVPAPIATTTVTKLPKAPHVIKVGSEDTIAQLRALRQHGSANLVEAESMAAGPALSSAPATQRREEEETRDLISEMLLRYCRGAEASSAGMSAKRKPDSAMQRAGAEATDTGGDETPAEDPAGTPTPEMVLFEELVELLTTRDVTPHLLELVRELLSRTRVIPHYGAGGSAQQQALMEEVRRREYGQQLILILLNQLREKKMQERMGIKTISTAALVQRVQEALRATADTPTPQPQPSPVGTSQRSTPSPAASGPVTVATHTTSACTRTTRFEVQEFRPPAPALSGLPNLSLFQLPFLERRGVAAPPASTLGLFHSGPLGLPLWGSHAPAAPAGGVGSGVRVGDYGNLFAPPEPSRMHRDYAVLSTPTPEAVPADCASDDDMMADLKDFMTAAAADSDADAEEPAPLAAGTPARHMDPTPVRDTPPSPGIAVGNTPDLSERRLTDAFSPQSHPSQQSALAFHFGAEAEAEDDDEVVQMRADSEEPKASGVKWNVLAEAFTPSTPWSGAEPDVAPHAATPSKRRQVSFDRVVVVKRTAHDSPAPAEMAEATL
eukprot:gene12023-8277_t